MSATVKTHVGQVVWHDLMTTDVERAKSFYGELLGWEFEVWKPGELDYTTITANGQQPGGIVTLDPAAGTPSHWVGYVLVDDVDAVAERATQAGGTVQVAPTDIPEVGRYAVLADPEGAVIAAVAPAHDMPSPQGVFVWEELLTTDVEGAKAFYETVLGWTNAAWEGEAPYTLFKSAGVQDVAGVMDKPAEDRSPPHWLTYLAVDDVDAAVEKARGLGATAYVEGVDVPDVGRIAVLGDPTGATVGLFRSATR
jgi:predicted enzyme related to lactoylglutathione lyase